MDRDRGLQPAGKSIFTADVARREDDSPEPPHSLPGSAVQSSNEMDIFVVCPVQTFNSVELDPYPHPVPLCLGNVPSVIIDALYQLM